MSHLLWIFLYLYRFFDAPETNFILYYLEIKLRNFLKYKALFFKLSDKLNSEQE